MKIQKIKIIFSLISLLIIFSLFLIACETEEDEEIQQMLHSDLDDKSEEAFRELFADVTELKEKNDNEYKVKSDGSSLGYAAIVEVMGHVDEIRILVSFDKIDDRRQVNEVVIIEHGESPGLGARIEDEDFISQFKDITRDELSLADDGGEIDRITGSTESSAAVIRGVREIFDAEEIDDPTAYPDSPENEMLEEIFPGFTDFEEVDEGKYEIYDEDSTLGHAKFVITQGHIDDILLLVGFDESRTLEGFVIVEQDETPPRFERIVEDNFEEQFEGLTAEEIAFDEDGGEIDAVTGATRTSEAIVNGVRKALNS